MIGVGRKAQGFNTPAPQEIQVTSLPAPNKGVDTQSALGNKDPQNSTYSYNVVPDESGMRVRGGYREWAIDLVLDVNVADGVKTIIVFDGSQTEPSDNRLFAITNEGIWDVTTYNTPVNVAVFDAQTTVNESGQGIFAHYTDQSGDNFLFYADGANGLWEYTEVTDVWAKATGITGPDLTKIAFVVVHKQRLWLVEQDSTVGWYLPIASKNGQAEPFYFGPKFTHGGELSALINWTVDGGAGVDDYLVAVSSAGDVIPYQGADPSVVVGEAAWQSTGTYYIGKIPAGRRFYSEFSGELYLLSSFGIIAMSDLLVGVDSRHSDHKSLTYPISSVIREALRKTSEQVGWEPLFLPSRGILLITSPLDPVSGKYIQYTMNIALEAWGYFRDVPAVVIAEWDQAVYFGTADGRICIVDVARDNVLIDQEDPLANGVPIKFSLLTAYNNADTPGLFKRGQLVRPDFISQIEPVYRTKILYDYSVTEKLFLVPPSPNVQGGQWDIGNWDQVVWGAGETANYSKIQGSGGMGRVMAVALQGETVESARLLSFDIMWIPGGPI